MRIPAAPNPDLVRPGGPWVHRDLSVNGTQLHIVETGNLRARQAIVLLHGFPQFWWCWRHVLAELADFDQRVVAVDLRGFGGSDRPPNGYDLLTLSRDVVGILTAVGATRAVVAGSGIGGSVAWLVPHLAPELVHAIMPISAPHPLQLRSRVGALVTPAAATYAYFQVPFLAAGTLRSGRLVRALLSGWSAREGRDTVMAEAARYGEVLHAPFAAECALRPLRALRRLSRAERRLLRQRVRCPVWSLRGGADRVLGPAAYARDADFTSAALTQIVIPGAGHFVPEEAPAAVAGALRRCVEDT